MFLRSAEARKKMTVREITHIALFTGMAVAAAVLVRFGGSIVPFSLLPFVMCLAGGVLGPRCGAYSMLAYMLLGLIGLPVFGSPPYGGPAYVFTPSFGFVPGFVLGAYVAGAISKKALADHRLSPARKTAMHIAASVAGIAALYAIGLPYLGLILNLYYGQPTSIARVLQIGFLPFALPDLIKALVAALIARRVSELPGSSASSPSSSVSCGR